MVELGQVVVVVDGGGVVVVVVVGRVGKHIVVRARVVGRWQVLRPRAVMPSHSRFVFTNAKTHLPA